MKEVKPKITPDQLLQSRRYDPNRELQPEQILFRIDNENIGSIQNIVTITGLPKQGKSRYMGALLGSALTNETIFSMQLKTAPGRNRIAFFDTEQGDYDFYRQMDFVKHICKTTTLPGNLDAFNTREDYPQEQLLMIDRYLELNPDCSILFLDGILDLLLSFNDEKESKMLMQLLKKWTKVNNLLLINVLHRRKDGTATLGHIGSAADRVSQSVLVVEKNKERKTFILKPEYLRSADEFNPLEIMYNRHLGEWQQTWYVPDEEDKKLIRLKKPKPQELDIHDHTINVGRIFQAHGSQTYKDLVQNISEIYAAGTNWAKECIPFLLQSGLIFKTATGYTRERQAKLYIQE